MELEAEAIMQDEQRAIDEMRGRGWDR